MILIVSVLPTKDFETTRCMNNNGWIIISRSFSINSKKQNIADVGTNGETIVEYLVMMI